MKKELGTYTGKTPEDAYRTALSETGMSEEQLKYDVIEKGKVTFFGIGSVKAKIVVYTEEEETLDKGSKEEPKAVETAEKEVKTEGMTDGERAVEFLKGLLNLLKSDAVPSLEKEGEKIEINLITSHSQEIIGKRGIKLDALQNLAGAVANIGREEYKRVVVDCNGYREKRDATLAHVAKKTADKAVRLGKKISLEPMSAYERRIIHATLADSTEVKTASEGKEPRRRVVIIPNEMKPYERRNNNNRRGDYRRDRNSGDRRDFRRENKKPRYNYTEEEKAERSRVSGGTSAATTEKGTAYKKSSSVVFGTFLGNSRKNDENKE